MIDIHQSLQNANTLKQVIFCSPDLLYLGLSILFALLTISRSVIFEGFIVCDSKQETLNILLDYSILFETVTTDSVNRQWRARDRRRGRGQHGQPP